MSYDKDNDNNNNSNNSNNINYYRGDSWMSYDNERSVALKAEFAYDAGLAGVRPFLLRNKKVMKNMAPSLSIITKSFSFTI